MNNNDIILKLKDDNEYYNGIGKQFLSNSDIGTLIKNPRAFGKPSEKTVEMVKGSYFHTSCLEPHKINSFEFVKASTRTTNIYKDAVANSMNDILLLESEKFEIDSMVNALRKNTDLLQLIWKTGNRYEVPYVGEIFGIPFKCKVDIVNENVRNYDLKSTSSIDDFRYSAKKYNYDSQSWIYRELTGLEMDFIVVEKGTNRLGLFKPTDEFYYSGEMKVLKAIENYNKFFAPNATEDIDQFYTISDLY